MEALTRGPLSRSDRKRRRAGRRQDEPQESSMPWDDGRDTIIDSDPHLAVSVDEGPGVPGPTDDFFCDAALVRFLDNLRERARNHGRGVRLVILGDLFDFLQLEIGSLGWARRSLDT